MDTWENWFPEYSVQYLSWIFTKQEAGILLYYGNLPEYSAQPMQELHNVCRDIGI
jgi:hypothetical protein